ncbi:MAG: hypothetical protein AB4058_08975 [Microcystaceae cyanobacterium]
MFLDELQPLAKEFLQQPLAFSNGFFSGLLRLKLSEDPLKSWLTDQGMSDFNFTDKTNDNGGGPQSISID